MPIALNPSAFTEVVNRLRALEGSDAHSELQTALSTALSSHGAPSVDTCTPWQPETDLHPCKSVDEVKAMVKMARAEKRVLRVAGSQHSAPQATFEPNNPRQLRIRLDGALRDIEVLENNVEEGYLLVRAGAGANLGINPSDPDSNASNSFNRIVDELGYALPILGGMSHQTLGGFMMTSTAGGSLDYGLGDALVAFDIVDGNGELRTLVKGTDDFDAAGVSMGLFGVVTSVTLKLGKRYLVKGYEETVKTSKSMLSSAERLQTALGEKPYVHAVWFPQPGVDRVLQFFADRAPTTEPIVPYEHVLKDPLQNYLAAGALAMANAFEAMGEVGRMLAAYVLDLMTPISKEPTKFCDHWYLALPNDDQALIDTLLRVQFTEIWLDVAKTPEVFDALKRLFAEDPMAAGNFGVEVYGAKASTFWMSPSYQRNVIRIDPYWWEYNQIGSLENFFEKYWAALMPIDTARLHWGKHLPKLGTQYGDVTIGPDYVRKAFPRFDEWLAKREQFDPDQVFLTDYWRGLFGIAPKS